MGRIDGTAVLDGDNASRSAVASLDVTTAAVVLTVAGAALGTFSHSDISVSEVVDGYRFEVAARGAFVFKPSDSAAAAEMLVSAGLLPDLSNRFHGVLATERVADAGSDTSNRTHEERDPAPRQVLWSVTIGAVMVWTGVLYAVGAWLNDPTTATQLGAAVTLLAGLTIGLGATLAWIGLNRRVAGSVVAVGAVACLVWVVGVVVPVVVADPYLIQANRTVLTGVAIGSMLAAYGAVLLLFRRAPEAGWWASTALLAIAVVLGAWQLESLGGVPANGSLAPTAHGGFYKDFIFTVDVGEPVTFEECYEGRGGFGHGKPVHVFADGRWISMIEVEASPAWFADPHRDETITECSYSGEYSFPDAAHYAFSVLAEGEPVLQVSRHELHPEELVTLVFEVPAS